MQALQSVGRFFPQSFKEQIRTSIVTLPGGHEFLRRFSHGFPAYVISYPKSGRTWLRLMMGKVLQEHYQLELARPSDLLEVDTFCRLNSRVPFLKFWHDDKPHKKVASALTFAKTQYKSSYVIFLCRDPRDVVVSNYFQETKREVVLKQSYGFDGPLSAFLRHEIHGIENIVSYMNIWAANQHVPKRFMLLRYEEMMEDVERELQRVVAFLDMGGVAAKVIEDAIEFGRFENMKQLEGADTLGSPWLKAINYADPDSYKVRRGKVGGFVDYLNADDLEFVNQAVSRLDPGFGYQL
jgi:hypothetical protein